MVKTEEGKSESEILWSTLEELLLASAVDRYGTESWESVAMEIQSRTSNLILNAQNCRKKYYDLQRRYDPKSNAPDYDYDNTTFSLLDQLRQLRVAQLRREVQRSDRSIVSLQQKVKKLKEERERSLKEKENGDDRSDLEKEMKIKSGEGLDKTTPGNEAGKPHSGEDSDKENRSVNESNSTDTKTKIEQKQEIKPEAPVSGKFEPVAGNDPAPGEGSYDGSSDTTAKPPEPAELRESVAESKSSDVQSSASLSRKRRRKRAFSGDSSGEEPDNDDISRALKQIDDKSHRLVRVLHVIRSHKLGSVFQRRLESQESKEYQKLIRQHMDLETIKSKLEEGLYSSNNNLEFYRDLLLLINNVLVFFPKNSPESTAALELRHLVSIQIPGSSLKTNLAQKPRDPPPPAPAPAPAPATATTHAKKPSLPPQQAHNQAQPKTNPAQTISARPLVACRKRSSISAKAAAVSHADAKPSRPMLDTKPGPDRRKEVDEPPPQKQRTRERSVSRARGARGNKSGGGGNAKLSNGGEETHEVKTGTKVENLSARKMGAAGFLNRMKRSSPLAGGTLLESLKEVSVRPSSGGSRGSGDQKKGGGRRDQSGGGGRNGASRKAVSELSNSGKRSVGRPPKRGAPRTPPPTSRKSKESESKPARKRIKR